MHQPPIHKFFHDLMNSSLSDIADREFVASRPSVNIFESRSEYRLELAAPGLSKSDIQIKIEDDILKLSANKEIEGSQEGWKRREFDYGKFSRTFRLTEDVDVENIQATYDQGVLTLILPKAAEVPAKEKTIEIK
jgi:HSP20 family protein